MLNYFFLFLYQNSGGGGNFYAKQESVFEAIILNAFDSQHMKTAVYDN